MNDSDLDARFDERLRARHAQALAQLSPRMRAQLQQRLQAAVGEKGPTRRHPVLPWTMAAAAALLLVAGLQWQARRPTLPAPAAESVAVGTDDLVYDDDPDFYLWLASSDAARLATE